MSKVNKFFKDVWNWLKNLFRKNKSQKEEKKEEEKEGGRVEKKESIPNPPTPIPPTPIPKSEGESGNSVPEELSPEFIGNAFSKPGLQGFIKIYGTKHFDKITHEHFHSIQDLLTCINRRGNNYAMSGSNSSITARSEFTGTASYQEAVDLLINGYVKILPEVKSGIDKDMNKFRELFIDSKSKPVSSVVGCSPNVPKYLMGLPHSMDDRTKDIQKVRTINIIYASQGPWYYSGDDFISSGISMLSAIQVLENSGISINLSCTMYTGFESKEAVIGTVQLKDYKDRLDLKKLCFPIAHPSMLRRIGFKFLETVPGLDNSRFNSGYGSSPSYNLLKEMFGDRPNTVILSLELIKGKFKCDVKQIVRYIKENARR